MSIQKPFQGILGPPEHPLSKISRSNPEHYLIADINFISFYIWLLLLKGVKWQKT